MDLTGLCPLCLAAGSVRLVVSERLQTKKEDAICKASRFLLKASWTMLSNLFCIIIDEQAPIKGIANTIRFNIFHHRLG